MYVPKWFDPEEIFPPEVLRELQGRGISPWTLMDDRALITADELRRLYGPTWCNTGNMHYRGFRPFGGATGSAWSQHKFGRALDLTFSNITAEEVRKEMLTGNRQFMPPFDFIRGIEIGISWFHFDVGNRPSPDGRVAQFKP